MSSISIIVFGFVIFAILSIGAGVIALVTVLYLRDAKRSDKSSLS